MKHRLWQKIVIHTPFFLSIKIFDTQRFLKHKRVPLRLFLVLWDKNFYKKSWYTPLFFYPKKNSISENFWNTEGWPYEFFRYCEAEIWEKICDKPPLLLSIKIFDTWSFSETQKGSPTKYFDTVRQNSFYGKSWNPLPLLSLTFFDTRRFLKHRRVFQRSFR